MTGKEPNAGPPRVRVISVGDELLLGETVDTNGAWLSSQLSQAGFVVQGRRVVGDDPERIQEAVRSGFEDTELVVMTGGLGPTPDDRTRHAVAEILGLPLGMDLRLLKDLQDRFRVRGYPSLPQGADAMALVPKGSTVLPNPHGAAPGLVLNDSEGGLCVLLPGIPREMEGIVREEMIPYLARRYKGRLRPVVHRVIHTVGIPESVLMARVEAALGEGVPGVGLAYLPEESGVRLRLSARVGVEGGPAEAEEGAAALDRAESLLEPILAPYRFWAASGDLAEAVGSALVDQNQCLAVAESCTGGLVAKRMTDLPGSSRYFVGGVVAYANQVKEGLLAVAPSVMEEHGVVSRRVAGSMAEGVARSLGTDVGLGVTGIAGPGGGSEEKPVGTVCFGVTVEGITLTRQELFLGDREAVRRRSAHAALGLLLGVLEGRDT